MRFNNRNVTRLESIKFGKQARKLADNPRVACPLRLLQRWVRSAPLVSHRLFLITRTRLDSSTANSFHLIYKVTEENCKTWSRLSSDS